MRATEEGERGMKLIADYLTAMNLFRYAAAAAAPAPKAQAVQIAGAGDRKTRRATLASG